ncbi:MAG: signal peptidase I [Acholeplasmataceae bacterium]|nr:signal peptidase I [Acholeplasmataceae bacterium]
MNIKNNKTLRLIKTVTFYILTLFLLAYVSISLFFPEKVIDILGFQITSISTATESMRPNIEPGDIIILKRIKEDSIEEQDVISFFNYARGTDQNGQTVWVKIRIVHRIIDIDDTTGAYITQGDNNTSVDTIYDEFGNVTELTYDQVIGGYVFRVPLVGKVITALRNPVLIGLLIVNIGIVVVIVKLLKKKDPEEDNDTKIEELKEEDKSNDLG